MRGSEDNHEVSDVSLTKLFRRVVKRSGALVRLDTYMSPKSRPLLSSSTGSDKGGENVLGGLAGDTTPELDTAAVSAAFFC